MGTLAAVLSFGLPGAPIAQQAGPTRQLSLEQALEQAEKLNPAFLQHANDIAVAESSVRAAWGDLLPSVSASSSFGYTAPGAQRLQTLVFAAEPANYSSSYDLSIRYQLSGATILQPQAERAHARAAELRVTGAAANLTSTVTLQYLEALRAKERVIQAEGEVARTTEYVRLAEALIAAGDGIELDLRRAEIQLGRAEVSLLQARHNAERQILVLAELLGGTVSSDVELTSAFAHFRPDWEAEELIEMAVARNPDLLSAQAARKAARTEISVARSAYLPSISAQAGWRGYDNRYASVDPLVERALAPGTIQACERENRIGALIERAPARVSIRPTPLRGSSSKVSSSKPTRVIRSATTPSPSRHPSPSRSRSSADSPANASSRRRRPRTRMRAMMSSHVSFDSGRKSRLRCRPWRRRTRPRWYRAG